MASPHPLDRPVWSALTSRWKPLSLGDDRARRLAPEYGPFAASADTSPESLAALAALAPAEGVLARLEAEDQPVPPGLTTILSAEAVQMVCDAVTPGEPDFAFAPLTDADAPEMLALAVLTKPGPFAERTNQLGGFIGVRIEGRLVAMAGERMKPTGFAEVSGVCTHPDARGRGYAAGLMRVVARGILARGETPFLHAYADNAGAISLYESLGFRLRRRVNVTMLQAWTPRIRRAHPARSKCRSQY